MHIDLRVVSIWTLNLTEVKNQFKQRNILCLHRVFIKRLLECRIITLIETDGNEDRKSFRGIHFFVMSKLTLEVITYEINI